MSRLHRIRAWLGAFGEARDGAMAIEFAMLAIPFVTMLFATLELGLIFMISLTLDNATQLAAREIRTGTLQTAGGASANTFKTDICSHMVWIQANCLANLNVDVRTYTTFTTAAPPSPIVGGVFNPALLAFNPGVAQDIVVVRGYYQWPMFTPFLNVALAKVGSNTAVITSTAAFRNEPYS